MKEVEVFCILRLRWIFLDVHGTLLYLDGVFERLWRRLKDLGYHLPLEDVEYATRQEFAYYTAHSLRGRDAPSLEALRLECGAMLLRALRERGHLLCLGPKEAIGLLLDSLEFRLYPDVLPALEALRHAGAHLGVISNWDYTLPRILRCLGLSEYLDVIAVSSVVGYEKPDAALFHEALRQAGATADLALHVGDSWERDVLGARSVGMLGVFLNRGGGPAILADAPTIGSLMELVRWVTEVPSLQREVPC